MSNESVDDSLSGGHSPSLLLSRDISSIYMNAASSTSQTLSRHFVDTIESSKNKLDTRDGRVTSNHMLNTPRDLSSSSSSSSSSCFSSSFSSNRPHYSIGSMPYSCPLKSVHQQSSQAPQVSSKQAFIHRSVSPLYLSSNSLSSSLSAISSSSVSSSSSSSDNDSLDELEHLASKFTHNIASIWSHSHEGAAYLHPSIASGSDNTSKQQSIYESRWLSHRQHNVPAQSSVDNSSNENAFHMKATTLADDLPSVDIFPSPHSSKSHDASPATNSQVKFKLPKDKVTLQMSPDGKNCQSIWSYECPVDHMGTDGGKKKSKVKAAQCGGKKNELKSRSCKSRRDICSMTRNSQVNLSGGNGIETIDLTEDDEAAACQVIDLSDQQAAYDNNGSMRWLENHLRLTSLNDTGDQISTVPFPPVNKVSLPVHTVACLY